MVKGTSGLNGALQTRRETSDDSVRQPSPGETVAAASEPSVAAGPEAETAVPDAHAEDVLEAVSVPPPAARIVTPPPLPSMDLGSPDAAGPVEDTAEAKKVGLPELQSVLPDGSNLNEPEHAWLKEFRGASKANQAVFESMFEGSDEAIHYRRGNLAANQVAKVVDYYDAEVAAGFKQGFKDGILASALGSLMRHLKVQPRTAQQLKVVAHPYDDLIKMAKVALKPSSFREVLFSSLEDSKKAKVEEIVEAGIHVEGSGKPLPEVGAVLGLVLAVTALVEGPGKKLPYAVRTLLKAAGGYPFFQHLVKGRIQDAWDEVKDGGYDEAIHQVLISGLMTTGLFMNKGMHQMAAGTVMESILAGIGQLTDNAGAKALLALDQAEASLPKTAMVVEGDTLVERPVAELVPGESIVELKQGDTVPADSKLLPLPDGRTSVMMDTTRTRGGEQAMFPGDSLDQGGTLVEDIRIHVRITAPADKSSAVTMLNQQKNTRESKTQSLAKNVGRYWVWATVAGTILTAAWSILRPMMKKQAVKFTQVLEKTTSFATLAAPCNILVATTIESATKLGLLKHGVQVLKGGEALSKARQVKTYFFDFSGTLSTLGQCTGYTFYDADGRKLSEEDAKQRFLEASAVGLRSNSQHPMQKGMQHALPWGEVESLSQSAEEAVELAGNGVTGRVAGHAVRVGHWNFALEHGTALTEAQRTLLRSEEERAKGQGSRTYLRVGDCVGVAHFSERLQPEAKKAIEAIGAERVRVITGINDREFILHFTRQLGIADDHVSTGLRPDEKEALIQAEKKKVGVVAMVGDGLNDGASLAAADVAYSVETGNHGILNSVDFVMNNLASIAPLETLSRKVNWASTSTLAFASLYTAVASLAQGMGKTNLNVIEAAFAHEGVSGAIAWLHGMGSGKLLKEFDASVQGLMA